MCESTHALLRTVLTTTTASKNFIAHQSSLPSRISLIFIMGTAPSKSVDPDPQIHTVTTTTTTTTTNDHKNNAHQIESVNPNNNNTNNNTNNTAKTSVDPQRPKGGMPLVHYVCRKKKKSYDVCVSNFYRRDFLNGASLNQEEVCGDKFDLYRTCVLKGIKREIWDRQHHLPPPKEGSPLAEVSDIVILDDDDDNHNDQ